MKVLVTGGAGYIGSVACEHLLTAGHEVVVFDNLSQGHRAAVPSDCAFVEGDLACPNAVDTLLRAHQPDAVMHFAAHSLVGQSVQEPFLYLGDNLTNGLNLLRGVVAHGVGRFILSSTANLFDHSERVPIDETVPIIPGSPYGESKLMLERMLYWLEQTKGLRFACLRYFNAAGATATRGEDHRPESHLIPLVLGVALDKRPDITVFGNDYPTPDGTCIRDYIHVADLAQAHILALEALDKGSRTYNLGIGKGFSVQEVIETARRITGHPIPVRMGPRRPGDAAVLVAASDKIREDLGWAPRHITLESIMQDAWKWHRAHPDGYRD